MEEGEASLISSYVWRQVCQMLLYKYERPRSFSSSSFISIQKLYVFVFLPLVRLFVITNFNVDMEGREAIVF